MIFKETKQYAVLVAKAVAKGEDYDRMVRTALVDLQKLPDCTMTDTMRFSVECQDALFQLLRMYRQAYEALTTNPLPEPTIERIK